MLRANIEATDEMEADRRLILEFPTYWDYLDDMNTKNDPKYFRSVILARKVAMLGYRSTGETISYEDFLKRWNRVQKSVSPLMAQSPCVSSQLAIGSDRLIEELAVRERANRSGIMLTIVFVRVMNKTNTELGGFIDFCQRLLYTDLAPFFKGKERLIPNCTDLGYFNWKTKSSCTNNSDQIESIICTKYRGLLFRHKWDKLIINPNPRQKPGICSARYFIKSPEYLQCIIYDHVIRSTC